MLNKYYSFLLHILTNKSAIGCQKGYSATALHPLSSKTSVEDYCCFLCCMHVVCSQISTYFSLFREESCKSHERNYKFPIPHILFSGKNQTIYQSPFFIGGNMLHWLHQWQYWIEAVATASLESDKSLWWRKIFTLHHAILISKSPLFRDEKLFIKDAYLVERPQNILNVKWIKEGCSIHIDK